MFTICKPYTSRAVCNQDHFAAVGIFHFETSINILVKVEMKQSHYRPGKAWSGPEGSRRLKLPDFKTVDT